MLDRQIDRQQQNILWIFPLLTFYGYDILRHKCIAKLRLHGNSLIESAELNERQKQALKQRFAQINFDNPDDVHVLEMYVNCVKAKLEPPKVGNVASKPITFVPPWVCDKFLQRSLLEDSVTADIVFIFQDDIDPNNRKPKQIAAHKCILASESTVFADMFKKSIDSSETSINVHKTSAEDFTVFLQLIYTIYPCEKHVTIKEIDDQNIDGILALANEFKVSSLIFPFEMQLVGTLNWQNAIFSFELAHKYSMKSLRTESVRLLKDYGTRILKSNAFLGCSRKMLKHLIELNVWDNERLIDACIKWAKKHCQEHQLDPNDLNDLQNALDDVLEMTPFASIMDLNNFLHEILSRKSCSDTVSALY